MARTYSAESQSINLEGVGNARQLGGYETCDGRLVREGVLLRSAVPYHATERDRSRLQHEFRLAEVLDLRMGMETGNLLEPYASKMANALGSSAAGEEIPFDFCVHTSVPIIDEMQMLAAFASMPPVDGHAPTMLETCLRSVDAGIVSTDMYIGFLENEVGRRGFARVLASLLSRSVGEATLFHCTQGKDRTGLAAMLVLDTLGVPVDTILFDYLLTNEFNAQVIEREKAGLKALGKSDDEVDHYMNVLDKVFPETMERAISHLEEAYGSVWGYVHEGLGLSEGDARDLRRLYLVD